MHPHQHGLASDFETPVNTSVPVGEPPDFGLREALRRAEVTMSRFLAGANCLLWQADVKDVGGDLLWMMEFLDPTSAQRFLPLDIPPGWNYLQAFQDSWHPDDVPAMHDLSRNSILSDSKGYRQEYRVKASSGEYRWLAETVSIHRVDEGEWRLTGVCTDITAGKKVEEALRRSEALYQGIVANVPGVVAQLIQHADGLIDCTYINAASHELLEREPQDFVTTPGLLIEALEVEYRQSFLDALSNGARSLEPFKWEGRCLLPSRRMKWIEVTARAQLQPKGELLWDLLLMDITPRKEMEDSLRLSQEGLQARIEERTSELMRANEKLQSEVAERKQAQEELRASETRYRAIVEDQTEMICRFLADGTRTFVNDAYCRYYNVQARDAVGTSFFSNPPPEVAAAMRAHLAALGPDNPVGHHEMRTDSGNGEVRWQRWTDRYICNEAGEFVCYQSVGHDITERKRTEEALLLAKEEAERANRAKSEFLSRVSHELRTPLNAILGFGQILSQLNLDPLQAESVQHILKGGRHLLKLIDEILDIARVEAGRTEVSIESLSVADVIRESVGLVTPLALQSHVSLSADTASFASYHAMADRQRLKQVLINLLTNAIKYNRPDGKVEVTCTSTEGRLRIEVSDTGIGIHPEDMRKLFIPFERLTASNSGVEGTGLGLAVSRQLVTLMQGTFDVKSELGLGSRFGIEFPVGNSPSEMIVATAPPQPNARAEAAPAKSFSLLCIEDNASNLRLVEAILSSRPGVRLEAAYDGRTGLELAKKIKPDLILLDLHLPDISGRQVLEMLRVANETSRIPVLVVSADATRSCAEDVLAMGADAFLTKPIDVSEFLSILDRFIG